MTDSEVHLFLVRGNGVREEIGFAWNFIPKRLPFFLRLSAFGLVIRSFDPSFLAVLKICFELLALMYSPRTIRCLALEVGVLYGPL